jgi:hypothetical protein
MRRLNELKWLTLKNSLSTRCRANHIRFQHTLTRDQCRFSLSLYPLPPNLVTCTSITTGDTFAAMASKEAFELQQNLTVLM